MDSAKKVKEEVQVMLIMHVGDCCNGDDDSTGLPFGEDLTRMDSLYR